MEAHNPSAAHKPLPKGERLEARVTGEQKRMIERAAEIRGTTITDLVVATVLEIATKVITEHDALVLNDEASKAFVSALLKPPVPNAEAKAAWRRYREQVNAR